MTKSTKKIRFKSLNSEQKILHDTLNSYGTNLSAKDVFTEGQITNKPLAQLAQAEANIAKPVIPKWETPTFNRPAYGESGFARSFEEFQKSTIPKWEQPQYKIENFGSTNSDNIIKPNTSLQQRVNDTTGINNRFKSSIPISAKEALLQQGSNTLLDNESNIVNKVSNISKFGKVTEMLGSVLNNPYMKGLSNVALAITPTDTVGNAEENAQLLLNSKNPTKVFDPFSTQQPVTPTSSILKQYENTPIQQQLPIQDTLAKFTPQNVVQPINTKPINDTINIPNNFPDMGKKTSVQDIYRYGNTYSNLPFTKNNSGVVLNDGAEGRTTINSKVDKNSDFYKRNKLAMEQLGGTLTNDEIAQLQREQQLVQKQADLQSSFNLNKFGR